MNFQHTHNAFTTQKSVAVCFKDVKTEETFRSQDQNLPICDNFRDENTPVQIRMRKDHYPSRTE